MIGVLRWLRSNLWTILLSLLVGLTIWVIVNQEQNPVREQDFSPDIKIVVTGLKDGLTITNDPASTTRLHLRAQQNTWSTLTPDQFTVTADLTGMGPGTHLVNLQIDVAAHATVIATNPSVVRFDLEEIKTRELPIQAHLDGDLAVGWTAGKAEINPARVEATGPKSAVDLISEVRATVQVRDVRQTISQTLPLVALDASGNAIQNVTLNPSQAAVNVPLKQDAGFRDVTIVPDPVGQPADGYYTTAVVVVPERITVRGDPLIVSGMQSYAKTEPVNLDGLTSDLIKEVTLDLPAGVTPVESAKIQVFVTIKALQSSRKFSPQVQVVGLEKGFTATVSPKTVDLILSGPMAILNVLSQDVDVVVTVDVTGLTAGTYSKEPNVQISQSQIVKESIFPRVITVTIKAGP